MQQAKLNSRHMMICTKLSTTDGVKDAYELARIKEK